MTIHRIKLKDLTAQFIQDLKKQLGDENQEIAFWLPATYLPKASNPPLSEEQFWQLINLLNWEKTGDSTAVIEPLVEELTKTSIEIIQSFDNWLSEKLYLLDGEKFAKHTGQNAYKEGQPFSTDTFLYARCCVVANGQEYYQQVLQNPSEMPKDLTFSALLRVAATAYERKTNQSYDYIPTYIYETFANTNGWPNYNLLESILSS